MDILIILLVAALLIAGFFVVIYNRLVALRQARLNAFSDIEVQLNLRYDLVPNLVETVKGYAAHEKGLLEQVTEARSRAMKGGSVNDKVHANNQLSGALMQLMAVAENYPDLKANENFAQLQRELADIENKVAASRRYFNNATNELNTAVEQFPAVLIAGRFGFSKEEFFESTEERKSQVQTPPTVKF